MEFRSVKRILILFLVFTIKPSYADRVDANNVEIWNTTKQYSSHEEWGNYITKCPIQEICPKYSKECTEDKVQWKDLAIQLQNSKEIVIMDFQNLQEATVDFPLHQNDRDELKRYICDMTLIQKRAEGCWILWLPNQCPWENITDKEAYEDTKDCEEKTIGEEDLGFFPRSCVGGAGWKGK